MLYLLTICRKRLSIAEWLCLVNKSHCLGISSIFLSYKLFQLPNIDLKRKERVKYIVKYFQA